MGGASSVSIDNLSSHQTSEITRLMKEQYDNICKNQQLDNQQQYEKLVQRYNEIVEKVKNTPHYMLPKEAPKQSKIFHRSVSHAKDSGKKKTIGRRRSFENNKTSKLSKTESNASELQESQSSPVLPAIDPQEDSWDSVTHQPSCMICGMVFSSANKLDTHTKYSALHKSNLLRIERLKEEEEQRKLNASISETEVESLPLPQEASERCRIFYSGSKLFWKEQFCVDLYIYLHIQPKILEVIAFDDKSTKEYPRLYFNEQKLLERIGQQTIDDAVNDYITEASNQRFKEALPPKSIIQEEMKRRLVSSHLLSNIHYQNDSIIYRLPEKSDSATPSVNDIPVSEIIYDSQPKDVIPVFITRRRHSTSEEIKNTVDDINVLQEDIRDLTRQAEILGSLITIGAMLFMKEGGARRQRLEAGKYTLPKRRWKSAINNVLKQLRVARTKRYLEKIRFQWQQSSS